MTEPAPESPPFAWLPVARVEAWLNVTTTEDPTIEHARLAAADWCEQQRRELFTVAAGELVVPERVIQAGVLATERLHARKGNGAGFGELAGAVLGGDPSVAQLLGVGRYAPPAVG